MAPALMNVFELAFPQVGGGRREGAGPQESEGAPDASGDTAGLTESVLRGNVLWFCRVRWTAVALLLALGAWCLAPAARDILAFRDPPGHWPFALALALAVANAAFRAHARFLETRRKLSGAAANLWAQIVLDLLVLTVAVHYCGSLETFLPFAFVIHVVLACVFFSKWKSLIVAGIATAAYVAAVALERTGTWPASSLFADPAFRDRMDAVRGAWLLNVAAAVTVWIVVWHLTSHLAAMVRRRDNELARTSRRLMRAQEEKAWHVLRTAHELKATLAGIYANTQLLLRGYCGEMPEPARKILDRILARSKRLASEIQEMLQLANLRSKSAGDLQFAEHDLADLLKDCVVQAEQIAAEHGVTIQSHLQPVRISGQEEHVRMMLANLVHNAVLYSHRGGTIEVECGCDGAGEARRGGDGPAARDSMTAAGEPRCATAAIADHGIGIPAEKLPRIFEEYYRTEEAARHNPESTGLGLAIVRHVAETHGVRVRVASTPGVGTRFTLQFPPSGAATHSTLLRAALSEAERAAETFGRKGNGHGVHTDL